MAAVSVGCVQHAVNGSLEENLGAAASVLEGAGDPPDVVLFPEFFSQPPMSPEAPLSEQEVGRVEAASRDFLKDISREHDIVTAGAALGFSDGVFLNRLHVFAGGNDLGIQEKMHPTKFERDRGVEWGRSWEHWKVDGYKLGGLVCADVLYPEACRIHGLAGVDLVFCPVASPFFEPDLTREARRQMFVTRALDNSCVILKAAGYTADASSPFRTVGRSLIAAPWGLLAVSADEWKSELIRADVDLELLQERRAKNYSLTDRNPQAIQGLFGDQAQ